VKTPSLIVPLVLVLELQNQVVHVQLITMNPLTNPVNNVTILVLNVLVVPIVVPSVLKVLTEAMSLLVAV
jgi:hypothetical protein